MSRVSNSEKHLAAAALSPVSKNTGKRHGSAVHLRALIGPSQSVSIGRSSPKAVVRESKKLLTWRITEHGLEQA
jgi:hypothetical protein